MPALNYPKPFLKWVGGKRQLLDEIFRSFNEVGAFDIGDKHPKHRSYYEPFLGGGAVYFEMRARGYRGRAILNDSNDRLMRTYMGVRDDVQRVIAGLKERKYDSEKYYAARGIDVDGYAEHADAAAWFIYMNRCCFNGLYRVNKKGQFNVPFGKYTNPLICDAANLHLASKALERTTLLSTDFEKAVRTAETGDLVYFDCPYAPVSKTADFTAYTRDGFTHDDQIRLRDCAWRLKNRGVNVVLSNADVEAVHRLYDKCFTLRRVEARRAINSDASRRGAVGELLIT